MTNSVDPDLRAVMRQVLRQRSLVELVAPDARTEFDKALWEQIDELGLVRLTRPEELGGSGAGWAESTALLSEAAAAGVQLPLAETDLLAGWLLDQAGRSDDLGVLDVVALDESGRGEVRWVSHTTHAVVLHCVGDDASAHVAESAALRTEEPRGAVAPTQRVQLDPAALPGVRLDLPPETVHRAYLRGALARSIQCVGAMERILELCLEHTTTRTQFGRALSRFQTVQNLVSDMAAEVSLARAATERAVAEAVANDLTGPGSIFRVAVAKSCAAHASSLVLRSAHQLHGAIGTTQEHPLHLLTMPVASWRNDFGNARRWDEEVALAVRSNGSAWSLVTRAS